MTNPPDRELAVFSAARQLPAGERAAYLDQACAGDTALRWRVEELLQAGDEAGNFLNGPAAAPASPAERPGDKIGRYKLLQQIGEGGCGVVYMAEQEEPVRRRVALKVIKLGMDTKNVIARFEAERQALALMDHPNIAKVLDAGATDTGRPYFVMELVRGIKITDFCDQNELSTRERLDLFIQVCHAIQHAHQKGVIHRDIKPSNVLVTMNDGVPMPKVIDFGIAKATEGKLTDQTVFTAFEQFIGTPAYMSPEQAEMSARDVDTRSDIYSLGVLLYELLTGRTPFDSKRLLQAGLDEIRRTIREEEPARPSTCLSTMLDTDLTTIAAHRQAEPPKLIHLVRGDLDWIVMKALEKERMRRYETANGLAMDIQRHLNHEPVVASPPGNFYRFKKMVRRNQLFFAAAGFVAAALVLALVVATVAAFRIQSVNQQIRKARDEATEKLRESYLEQARALRISRLPGQRFAGLEAVNNAAAIRKDITVRNETIACLGLSDLRVAKQAAFMQPVPNDYIFPVPDFNLEKYAVYPAGDTNGSITIRAVSDDKVLAVLSAPGFRVVEIKRFSLNSRFLLVLYQKNEGGSCSDWVWDLESGQAVLRELPDGEQTDWALAVGDFSPDSRLFVTCQPDETLCIYDLNSGKVLKQFPGGRLVYTLKLNSGNTQLACSSSLDPKVEIFDVESGRIVRTLECPSGITAAAWSPDGRHLATGCYDYHIYLWNIFTGEREREFDGHTDVVVSTAFDHKGNLLVSSSWDGLIRLWDVESGRELANHPCSSYQLQFTPDDRQVLGWCNRIHGGLVAGSLEVAYSRECRLLHAEPEVMKYLSGILSCPEFNADGHIIAGGAPFHVHFWDVFSGRQIGSFNDVPRAILFPPDGRSFYTIHYTSGVSRRSWERIADSGSISYRLGKPVQIFDLDGLQGKDITSDGHYLAMAHESEMEALVLDLHDPSAKPLSLQPHPRVSTVAISPDGHWAATAAWVSTLVKVWDVRSRACVQTWRLPGRASVTFSPDGRWLATSSTEYQLWEVGSWQPRGPAVSADPNPDLNYTAFSPDGKVMARKMDGRKIELVKTSTGKPLATLEAPDLIRLGQFKFSPDGTRIAAIRADQNMQLWDLRLIRQELAQRDLDWDLPPYPPDTNALDQLPATLEIESDDASAK